jgi:hypothetical protein
VDYELMHCDIKFLSGERPPALEVPISTAYWSKRGFLGAMPEKGSLVICGFRDVHEGEATHPLILGFLPNGSKTALRYHPLNPGGERDADEVDVPQEDVVKELEGIYDVDRHKMRKIYPGDIFGMSDKGAELLLNENVRLFGKDGSEFQLRSEDKSSLISTLDFYRTTAASRKRAGRVVRNGLNMPSDFIEDGVLDEAHPLFEEMVEQGFVFEDGTLVDDINSLPFARLSSGERHSVITDNQVNPNDTNARAFVEERSEIQEFSDQRMPQSEELGFDADRFGENTSFNPFIEHVQGTVVGNDPYTSRGRSRYGELLRPSLFQSPDDDEGTPNMEVVPNQSSSQQKNMVAASMYRMRRPDGLGELFYAHDKEGHVFFSIPRSTSNASSLGAGRSIEGDIKGSTKLTMGANTSDGESMDLTARGGFKWNLGTASNSNRSLDLTSKGGLSFEVNGSDVDGFAYNGTYNGDYGESVSGSKGVSVSGEHTEEVGGKKSISVGSLNQSIGTGNMKTTVAGDRSTDVLGHDSEQIGQGQETTIINSDENSNVADKTDIKSGDRTCDFLAPAEDRISFASSGTMTRESNVQMDYTLSSDGAGTFRTEAESGSYTVDMGAGSISLTASSGNIDLTAGVTISMEATSINMNGQVGLGNGANAPNAVIGGNAGPSPHRDYIVGIPLLGNPKVKTV